MIYDNTMKWMFQILKSFDGDVTEVVTAGRDKCEEARKLFIDKGAIISDAVEVDDDYEPFVGVGDVCM